MCGLKRLGRSTVVCPKDRAACHRRIPNSWAWLPTENVNKINIH